MLIDFFAHHWLLVIISIVCSYLVSSVNTSIIVTGIVRHEDIRKLGSGNAGFTNVLRCVGKVPAVITFVGDFLKGVISVMIPYLLTWGWDSADAQSERGILMYIAGLFAILGHMFPLYYKFKGGKGVVTTASVMLMTDWRALVLTLLIFLIVFIITKTISKGSLTAAVFYPFITAGLRFADTAGILSVTAPTKEPTPMFIACVFAITLLSSLAVIIKHKENIKRILNGTEKKITAKK